MSTQALLSSLNAVHNLEAKLADHVGSKIPNTTSLISKFIWADIIAENTQLLLNNLFAADYYFTKKLLPTVAVDIKALEASAKQCVEAVGVDEEEKVDGNEALLFLEVWKGEYHEALTKMIVHFLDVCRSRDYTRNKDLADVLTTLISSSNGCGGGDNLLSSPSSKISSNNLATLAIKTVASHPNIDVVLVGMRSDAYVMDALDAVCESSPQQSPSSSTASKDSTRTGLLKKEALDRILENMNLHQKL